VLGFEPITYGFEPMTYGSESDRAIYYTTAPHRQEGKGKDYLHRVVRVASWKQLELEKGGIEDKREETMQEREVNCTSNTISSKAMKSIQINFLIRTKSLKTLVW